MRAAGFLAAAALAVALPLAGCGTPKPTVATCTAELVAHPREKTFGPGCKGLPYNQQLQAAFAAYAQGARN